MLTRALSDNIFLEVNAGKQSLQVNEAQSIHDAGVIKQKSP